MGASDLLYRLYERSLVRELGDAPMPQHVGVILDGNRRFARERGLADVAEGHLAGAQRIEPFLGWCAELGIPIVTLWLLSTDNLDRGDEVAPLLRIIEDAVHDLACDESNAERGWRFTVVGALDLLPAETRRRLQEAEEATAHHRGMRVQVAVGYGGRQEITDALRSLLLDAAGRGRSLEQIAAELRPEDIGDHLYTTGLPDPDLIIRTSGEVRLSGFLLWQSAHSEFHFCDAYWPDFRRVDFLRALREYAQRTRRYGR
ncbi:isoprenyl transferase [Nitriliruptor alkaliphilus]|uniref:isoprenyl transferase n=1 Tax=Nitriliruptor alkaliphilus TaxID=427918 RepID=UPI000698864E|nr:isoprenyl transferase [Nitriliruptor alkaliphilus]